MSHDLSLKSIELFVFNELDVLRARKHGDAMALAMGFNEIERAEIEIAIGEMTSNIVKYARSGGEIVLDPNGRGNDVSLKIISRNMPEKPTDSRDLEHYLEDGFSTSGSLGIGLSGIRRVMDEFESEIRSDGWIIITAVKHRRQIFKGRVRYSVMNFPKQGERLSGDAFFIKSLPASFFWGLVDALGHGSGAYLTATKALNVLENNHTRTLPWIITRCHEALQNDRGAAICLGRIDFTSNVIEYISVGNVETRIYTNERMTQLHCMNGTVGVMLPKLDILTRPWQPYSCLVSFTDGVSNRFDLAREALSLSPQEMAHTIVTNFRRDYDDTTVMVAR